MHIVYILISQKDANKYYIGLTDNLERRLKKHNLSQTHYSKRYTPWQIETYIVFKSKHLAVQFEKYLKSGSGHAFLKKRLLPEL